MTLREKRFFSILSAVPVLLLIPFIGMHFSDEIKWGPDDFFVAGILLLGTGLLIEGVLRKVKKRNLRIALCALVLLGLFLTWAELAVGLFGTVLAGS